MIELKFIIFQGSKFNVYGFKRDCRLINLLSLCNRNMKLNRAFSQVTLHDINPAFADRNNNSFHILIANAKKITWVGNCFMY